MSQPSEPPTNDPIINLRRSIVQWAKVFEALSPAIPSYTSFLHTAYLDLCSKGIPSDAAATMATQLLSIHLLYWLKQKDPQETTDPGMEFLKAFVAKGNQ